MAKVGGSEQESVDGMLRCVEEFCKKTPCFKVQTVGLGIFVQPGVAPTNKPTFVLTVPVVRSEEVSSHHKALMGESLSNPHFEAEYYLPHRWTPHITLAQRDDGMDQEVLGMAVTHLTANHASFDWEIDITCIIVRVMHGPGGKTVDHHFMLQPRPTVTTPPATTTEKEEEGV